MWTVGGQRITRNSDKEQYLTVSSGKNGAAATISYRIPAGTDALKNMKEGDVKYYDVHLVPDETVFSVKDDNGDALLNMGKGGEPGWNIGRDKSTYNKDTGARVGYPYANNDWSRAIIQRLKPTPAGKIPLFGKGLQRPNTASKTMFDKENLTFDAAEGKADIYHTIPTVPATPCPVERKSKPFWKCMRRTLRRTSLKTLRRPCRTSGIIRACGGMEAWKSPRTALRFPTTKFNG